MPSMPTIIAAIAASRCRQAIRREASGSISRSGYLVTVVVAQTVLLRRRRFAATACSRASKAHRHLRLGAVPAVDRGILNLGICSACGGPWRGFAPMARLMQQVDEIAGQPRIPGAAAAPMLAR